MAEATNPYKVLEIERDASTARIKKAYRQLARRHHPDLNPGDAEAASRFKAVALAYELLVDPSRRAAFDRSGRRQTERPSTDGRLQAFLEEFDQQLKLMEGLFFEEILPRMLDTWYRGRGIELLARVLDDVERHSLLQRAGGEAPSDEGRARADEVRRSCPVQWRPVEMIDGSNNPVLGTLRQSAALRGRGVEIAYMIELYPGSFLTSGVRDPDALGAAILPVLATECVRYLESFVPTADRPLYARAAQAAGLVPQGITVAAARRRDTRFVVTRWAGVIGFVLIALALLAAIVPGFV